MFRLTIFHSSREDAAREAIRRIGHTRGFGLISYEETETRREFLVKVSGPDLAALHEWQLEAPSDDMAKPPLGTLLKYTPF